MPEDSSREISEISKEFDLSGINIEFQFEIRDKPIKTRSGKTPLLIKDNTL